MAISVTKCKNIKGKAWSLLMMQRSWDSCYNLLKWHVMRLFWQKSKFSTQHMTAIIYACFFPSTRLLTENCQLIFDVMSLWILNTHNSVRSNIKDELFQFYLDEFLSKFRTLILMSWKFQFAGLHFANGTSNISVEGKAEFCISHFILEGGK